MISMVYFRSLINANWCFVLILDNSNQAKEAATIIHGMELLLSCIIHSTNIGQPLLGVNIIKTKKESSYIREQQMDLRQQVHHSMLTGTLAIISCGERK